MGMAKRNGVISEEKDAGDAEQVSLDSDLFHVFDDDEDEDDDGAINDIAIDDGVFSFDGDNIGDVLEPNESKELELDKNEEPKTTVKAKKKRQSLKIERADRGLPPPRWHSEVADRVHREKIQMEIAKMLQMRKISPPSEKWLQQLPHKVRKLEERLYRSAPSLEAYLDRTTLKARLKALAKAITQQYKEAKNRRLLSMSSRSLVSPYSTRVPYGNFSSRPSIDPTASLECSQSLPTRLAKNEIRPITTLSNSGLKESERHSLPFSLQQQMRNDQECAESTHDNTLSSRSFTYGLSRPEMPDALNEPFHRGRLECQWNQKEQPTLPQMIYPMIDGTSGMLLTQDSLIPPLPTSKTNPIDGSHSSIGVNIPQNILDMNSSSVISTDSICGNYAGNFNRCGPFSGSAQFGQSMTIMMFNSAASTRFNPTLEGIHLQQGHLQHNQMQYGVHTHQMQVLQQNNPSVLNENSSFGMATQLHSMTPNYYVSNTINTHMPPPPRIYQRSMPSSTIMKSSGTLQDNESCKGSEEG